MNGGLQTLQNTKGVGAKIDGAVLLNDVTLPGLVDDFTGRSADRLVAVLLIAQPRGV
jgi:hypothetical protein